MSGHGHNHGHGNTGQNQGNSGYEPTDAHAKPLIVFVVVLAAFTIGCFVAGFIFFRLLEKGGSMIDPGMHPMAAERKIVEGLPKLQIHEAADLATYRAAEKQKIESYGWISREASVVRVPVEKAIDLLLRNKELKSRE